MTSVSASHIILTPTQPVGSGRPQGESNPGPPHQLSYRAIHIMTAITVAVIAIVITTAVTTSLLLLRVSK